MEDVDTAEPRDFQCGEAVPFTCNPFGKEYLPSGDCPDALMPAGLTGSCGEA
jgi:hypothetical protein